MSTAGIRPDTPTTPSVSPLEDGQRLGRAEFERRYDAMSGLRKAELIDGVVHMPPVSIEGHAEPHLSLATWLGVYKAATPGVRGGDNASIQPQYQHKERAMSTAGIRPDTSTTPSVPPLEDGQRLSRAEFERRYDALPGLRKAELIDGVVHLPPVSIEGHAEPHFSLAGWLMVYKAATPGVRGGDNASLRLDTSSEPQPDLCLFIDPRRGGRARIDADGYLSGGPELVAEIARSSIHRDLGARLAMYQRNGVCEYLVWRIEAHAIDWFVLREGQFVRQTPDAAGILKSAVFPGLWLDAAAAVADDLPRLLAVLQQGIASPEHAAFVAQLSLAAPHP